MVSNGALDGKVSFEAALDKAGFGLYSYTLTALSGLVVISFSCIAYSTSIIIPTSACELNTTGSQQGLMAAMPLIGTILGGTIWGYLGDTRGRRKMLLVLLVAGALFNVAASLSVNWIMLMVIYFAASLCASGQFTLSKTLLSESVPILKRNLVVLLVTSISFLTQGIMAALAIPIVPLSFSYYLPALDIYWNSWRVLILVYSCPSIISAVWLFFMQESPKFIFNKQGEEEALVILQTIHRINNRTPGEELQVKGINSEIIQTPAVSSAKDQIVPLFKAPLLKYTIIVTILFVFQQVGAFAVWLPTIANQFIQVIETGEGTNLPICDVIELSINQEIPADPDATPCALNVTALLIVLGVGAAQSVVNAVLSLFVNRIGRRNMVIVISAICGGFGILSNLIPHAVTSLVFFLVFMLGLMLIGVYTAICVALFPTHLRAIAVALTMTGERVATFVSIQVLNYLFLNNCNLGFYLFTSIFASSAIVAAFLPDDRRLIQNAPPIKESEKQKTERASL